MEAGGGFGSTLTLLEEASNVVSVIMSLERGIVSHLEAVDAWHRRGLAGGLVIPPILSPTRQLLWPLLIKIFDQ